MYPSNKLPDVPMDVICARVSAGRERWRVLMTTDINIGLYERGRSEVERKERERTVEESRSKNYKW